MNAFWFVISPIDVEESGPIEIIPEHWFTRADSLQIKIIKEKLASVIQPYEVPPYEYDWVEQKVVEPNRRQWMQVPLPEEKWRYWVINCDKGNLEAHTVGMAASLLANEFELGFTWSKFGEGSAFGWQRGTAGFFGYRGMRTVPFLKTGELKEITANYQKLKLAEAGQSHVYKAAERFDSLQVLPRHSEMLVVGYFAIIEALIAHKPRLQESLDSINHQLRSKMVLLSKRFRRKIDYGSYFGTLNEESVWKLLYAYRSSVAHDTLIDFKASFSSLKNQTVVLSFLREVVKSLLLFGLDEPVFLTDLKNC